MTVTCHCHMITLTKSSRKKVILGHNKNYATLALNYILKNSNRMILVSEIDRRYRKNDIE